MINVLVVDDHHLVRTSIAYLINQESDITVADEACDGESAEALCRDQSPDVVLMDLRMPGIGGLEATKRIHRRMPDIKLLVLTAHIEPSIARHVFDAGAAGFVTKTTAPEEMVAAIRHVFHGRRYVGNNMAQHLAIDTLSDDTNLFDRLSQRELQIALMVVNCQRVRDIATHLHLSPKTVNTYRYRLFDKLGISSDVELTHLALHHGLVDGFETIAG